MIYYFATLAGEGQTQICSLAALTILGTDLAQSPTGHRAANKFFEIADLALAAVFIQITFDATVEVRQANQLDITSRATISIFDALNANVPVGLADHALFGTLAVVTVITLYTHTRILGDVANHAARGALPVFGTTLQAGMRLGVAIPFTDTGAMFVEQAIDTNMLFEPAMGSPAAIAI